MSEKPEAKRKLTTELVVAISALAISLFTVFIYIYQARIMAKQHQDSVWPYIYSGKSINSEDGLTIRITNKGIGPAIIKSAHIELNNEIYYSWSAALKAIGLDSVNYYCSNVVGTVLSPSEEIPVFGVQNMDEAKQLWEKIQQLNIIIGYCSIHNECWSNENDKSFDKIEPKPGESGILCQ